MIVDVHAHYLPSAYREALAGLGRPRRPSSLPDGDDEGHLEQRLQMMDEAGVQMQVLSPTGGCDPYARDEAAAVTAARLANDLTAKLVARYPDRFRGFASLPLPHVEASLRELERAVDDLGMIGVNLFTAFEGRSVAEDELLPIYEAIEARTGIIFYHPCVNGICSPMIADYGFNAAVGTSLEDAVIGLHLIAKRIPFQFPGIRHIIPHLGGPLPMLLERLDNQFPMAHNKLPEPPSVTARRFYYDTVGHGSHAALLCAWKAFGAEHLLPGSDFPVLQGIEPYARTLGWVRDVGLPPHDLAQILERTAPGLLAVSC